MMLRIGGPGKGMVVAATRQICGDLYDQIIALRPDWAGQDIRSGKVQVLYTASASDGPELARFARNNQDSRLLQKRLKDPDDELELIIVQGMLLTGFDAPLLHTLYLDRPLKGALLMQTLARINRTYKGKEEGLLVGYLPLVENLKKALGEYARGDGSGGPNENDMQTSAEKGLDLITQIEGLLGPVTGWKALLDRKPDGQKEALKRVIGYLLRNRQAPEPQLIEVPGQQARKVAEKSIYSKFAERSSRLSNLYNLVSHHRGNAMVDRLKAQRNLVRFLKRCGLARQRS